MADDFEAETGCSISEAELEKMYAGKYLGAVDVGDRKIRTKILQVYKEELRQQDGKMRDKAILALSGLDKTLPLNATNRLVLKDAFGAPEKWVGRMIGLRTVPRTIGGRATRGIEIVILGGNTFKAAAAPMPTKKPAPKAAAAEWPEEEGDPGFDPDLNDSPDFDHATAE